MATSTEKIRCLVVDDAALMPATLKQLLESDSDVEVIATASNGPVALQKIRELNPCVVTLDVEMPGMDGISLLREIMSDCPTPVVIVSSHTHDGAHQTLEAMEAGAVDYVPKPEGKKGVGLREVATLLISKVKDAAGTNMAALCRMAGWSEAAPVRKLPVMTPDIDSFVKEHVIAIGVSCGGPAALAEIFPSIPQHMPPVVVAQHMPEGFTNSFAERLDRTSSLEVKEAQDGDLLIPNRALIAPGHSHMTLTRQNQRLQARLDQGPNVCGHRPSVDKLFRSVARACGSSCTGVIMTGMGNDGAEALGEIKAAGGLTIAQDEKSCIVYGMPKAAIEMGHVERVLPLHEIVPSLTAITRLKT